MNAISCIYSAARQFVNPTEILIYTPIHNTDIQKMDSNKRKRYIVIVYLTKVVDLTKTQISWMQKYVNPFS